MENKLEIGETYTLEQLFGFAKENKNILILSKEHIESGFWTMAKSQKFKVCDTDSAAWCKYGSSPPLADITIYYIKLNKQ